MKRYERHEQEDGGGGGGKERHTEIEDSSYLPHGSLLISKSWSQESKTNMFTFKTEFPYSVDLGTF